MDVKPHWDEIRSVFAQAGKTVRHVTMATINEDGTPHITPIGSLLLFDDCRGVYCEVFPKRFAGNLDRDPRVCIMAVNNGFGFWMKSLYKGNFETMPAVRLLGRAGKRRTGTEDEVRAWKSRVRMYRWFKGHDLLWKDMHYARDIYFESFEPASAGRMTQGISGG